MTKIISESAKNDCSLARSSNFTVNYKNTGQQQKYTLSETSQTLLIFGRRFRIRHPFFLSHQNFAVLPDWRFLGRLLAFRIFFRILKKIFILKENKIIRDLE